MKAEFTENGTLIVFAENNTERIALKHWNEHFNTESNDLSYEASCLAIDYESYKRTAVQIDTT